MRFVFTLFGTVHLAVPGEEREIRMHGLSGILDDSSSERLSVVECLTQDDLLTVVDKMQIHDADLSTREGVLHQLIKDPINLPDALMIVAVKRLADGPPDTIDPWIEVTPQIQAAREALRTAASAGISSVSRQLAQMFYRAPVVSDATGEPQAYFVENENMETRRIMMMRVEFLARHNHAKFILEQIARKQRQVPGPKERLSLLKEYPLVGIYNDLLPVRLLGHFLLRKRGGSLGECPPDEIWVKGRTGPLVRIKKARAEAGPL